MPSLRSMLAGAQAFKAHRDLEDGGLFLEAHLQLALGLLHHLLGSLAQGFHLQDGHLLGEVQDHLVDVRNPAPVHESGRGGETGEKAELEGFVDLFDVGTVEVKFHGEVSTAKNATSAMKCGVG
jgi:hypothetical protein